MDTKPIIKIHNLSVTYFKGKPNEMHSLKNINLEIFPGEFVIFFGPSGCGKSTLLYSISGLETNISGEIFISNQNISQLEVKELEYFHQQKIGMIFQAYYLISSLSVLKNVILPQVSNNKISNHERKLRAFNLLKKFGLEREINRFPGELSGGQQQRVAISRALINNPEVLLADEPTGNLDSKSSGDVLNLFSELNEEQHKTIILVTHNPANLDIANRVFFMKDGELVSVQKNRSIGEKFIRKEAPVANKKGDKSLPEDIGPIVKGFRLLKESYVGLVSNPATDQLIELKAKEIILEVLTKMSSIELSSINLYVRRLLVFGINDKDKMFHYLDDSIKRGGLGLDRRTARNITRKIKDIVKRIELLSHQEKEMEVYDFNDMALQARLYLEDEFKIKFTNEDIRQRFNESIKNRLQVQINKNDLRQFINKSISQGGVGINIRKANKISNRLELLILGRYNNRI